MRQVANQYFVHQINGPKNIMYNKQDKGMVIVPANEQGVNA